MNKTDPNHSAFPSDQTNAIADQGLTKREYMATEIFAGLIAKGAGMAPAAAIAIQATDSLIAELNKTPDKK